MTEAKRRIRRAGAFRLGMAVLLVFAILVPVAVFAASPAPSGSDDPGASASASADASASAAASTEATASTEPSASAPASAPAAPLAPQSTTKPDTSKTDGSKGQRGGSGFGGITITGIAGSKLSLETADGWTRTIVVTADTKITKGGKAATVSDLDLGDKITFRQKRNDDGTYTITSINVPTPKAAGKVTAVGSTTLTLTAGRGDKTRVITVNSATVYTFGKDTRRPRATSSSARTSWPSGTVSGDTFTATSVRIQPSVVGGEVTAKTSTSLTLKTRDGKSVTVHIDSSTKVFVRGKKDATVADLAVGDKVLASGALNADGSVDADMVGGGKFGRGGHDGDKSAPSASPTT